MFGTVKSNLILIVVGLLIMLVSSVAKAETTLDGISAADLAKVEQAALVLPILQEELAAARERTNSDREDSSSREDNRYVDYLDAIYVSDDVKGVAFTGANTLNLRIGGSTLFSRVKKHKLHYVRDYKSSTGDWIVSFEKRGNQYVVTGYWGAAENW